jgi:hypothetical protein
MEDGRRTRRRYPRVRSDNIISLRPVSAPGGKKVLAISKTLGLGGLMFESERKVAVDENLEMSILAGLDLIPTTVRVVWTEKGEREKWAVGVEFLDMSEEDRTRILDYLMQRVYLEEEEGFTGGSRT